MIVRSRASALLGTLAALVASAAHSQALVVDSQGCSQAAALVAVMAVGARRSQMLVVVGDTCLSIFL